MTPKKTKKRLDSWLAKKKINTSTIHQTANKNKFDLILTDFAQISEARFKTNPCHVSYCRIVACRQHDEIFSSLRSAILLCVRGRNSQWSGVYWPVANCTSGQGCILTKSRLRIWAWNCEMFVFSPLFLSDFFFTHKPDICYCLQLLFEVYSQFHVYVFQGQNVNESLIHNLDSRSFDVPSVSASLEVPQWQPEGNSSVEIPQIFVSYIFS